MDFLTLANSAHETTRAFLRILTETTANEDDDFTHLENASSEPDAATIIGTPYPENTMENRPLLSPTAEAALLELSTNFLLCKCLRIR